MTQAPFLTRRSVVTLFGLALAGCAGANGPAQTIKAMWTALDEGRIADALKLMELPPGFEAKASMAMTRVVEELKSQGGLAAVEIGKEEVTGDTAVVQYRLKLKSPKAGAGLAEKEHNDKLRKVDGRWLLRMV